jgi:hypothetical protein
MTPTISTKSIQTILARYFFPQDRIDSLRVTTTPGGEALLVVRVQRAYAGERWATECYDVTGAD